MSSVQRPRVFLDVDIGGEPAGRITIELFADQTPRTCENFRQLCTGEHKGLSYARSPFHRVIDGFMLQGGDIAAGDGTGVVSIYGEEFADENLKWRDMDGAGLVCSANSGKDTNGSQFFITLEPAEHLNGKHTIFGRVVVGHDTVQKIAKVDVDKNDKPSAPVLVSRCGELERRKKQAPAEAPRVQVPQSRDRGRRRKSDDSDVEMENSPEPGQPKKKRRQSDNIVDEGIRGRPRQRSGSRSHSRSRERARSSAETSDDSQLSSPAKKHKRKRSPSPSRGENANGHSRRRRSLPNQYQKRETQKAEPDDQGERTKAKYGDQQRGTRGENRNRNRKDDRYRSAQDRKPQISDGRLGGEGREGHEPPVKFKGRGIMKYREADRL